MTGITAGLPTGGKSSRMGCDKALLPYRGETFLSHLAGQLDWCDEILISVGRTGGEALAPWGTLVRDELEGFGPVEGIYQLLRRAGSPYVLVAAADMQRSARPNAPSIPVPGAVVKHDIIGLFPFGKRTVHGKV